MEFHCIHGTVQLPAQIGPEMMSIQLKTAVRFALMVMALAGLGLLSNHAFACQDDETPVQGVTYSNPIQAKWKIGAKIRGGRSPVHNMLLTLPLPTDWPEQSVTLTDEDIPTNIGRVKYRELNSGVRQLIVSIPKVNAREEITVSVTVHVSTCQIDEPEDKTVFLRPRSNHREGKSYLGISPQINYRNAKLRKLVKQLVADKENVWEEVETVFDWVRDNIEDREQDAEDVISVFRSKIGCTEDKVGLFVAMCRANKIPARMVWVAGTQYAEFMLVDENKKAHWFPCNLAGIREFGSTSEPRIVLQKGDSIKVPEKEARQKLVAEFVTCTGKSRPSVQFFRQLLPVD